MSEKLERWITDPRDFLCEDKYFSLQPIPLRRMLHRAGLSATAQGVFWEHWSEGQMNGSWCSTIPYAEMQERLGCSESSIVRAYQALEAEGLIVRTRQPRRPGDAFREAPSLVEVRIPRSWLSLLAKSPSRRRPSAEHQVPKEPESDTSFSQAEVRPKSDSDVPVLPEFDKNAYNAAFGKLSHEERMRLSQAHLYGHERFDWPADTTVPVEDRKVIDAFLLRSAMQRAVERPAPPPKKKAASRKIVGSTVFLATRVRRQLTDIAPGSADRLLREIMWSITKGALSRLGKTPDHAANIALKKVRQRLWQTPNDMPQGWRFFADGPRHA